MKFRHTLLCLGVLSVASGAIANTTAVVPLPPPKLAQSLADFTTDPVWQRKFIGDWVFRSAVEPRLTTEEGQVLTQAQPFLTINDIAGAREVILASLRAKPEADQNAALQFTVGNLFLAEDKPDEARVWYERAVKRFPDFLRAHKNLGFIAIRKGEEGIDDAIKHFTRAIQLGEGDGKTFGLLAYAYQQKGMPLAAEAAYRRAMVDDGESRDWKLGLAAVLFTQNRFLEASAIYGDLIRMFPNNVDYWMAQANCYVALENYPLAITNFEIARRLGSIRADALVLLGNLYVQRGLYNVAAGVFLEAVRTRPDVLQLRTALQSAQTLANFGASSESIELVQAVRQAYAGRMDPDSELSLLTLEAANYTLQGDPERAASILRQVIQRDPLNGPALIQLAIYHELRGERPQARLYLERATEVRDETTRIRALKSLGQLLVRDRQFNAALGYLNQALAMQPDESLRAFISQVEFARRQFEAATR